MEFDARAAKLLQAGQHLTVALCPGLRLVGYVTRKTWVYRYKSPLDSRMRQISIGSWPQLGLPQAMAAWGELRSQREAGADLAIEKRATRQQQQAHEAQHPRSYLVKHLVQDYLTHHIEPRRKPKGAAEVRRLLERYISSIENLTAHKLQRRQAYVALEAIQHTPVLASQVRQEMGGAYDYGLDSGKLPEDTPNWWRQIMRGKLRSKGKIIKGRHVGTGKRVLTPEEIGQLIRWLPNFSRTVSDALTMYLWTGTRGDEIMAMRGDEVTEEADGFWWRVPKSKTKNARIPEATDHRIPLIGRALEVVQRRIEAYGSGYLYPSRGGKHPHCLQGILSTAVWNAMPECTLRPDKYRPRLPVSSWSPHDLRRTTRTQLAALRCPRDVAEVIIGHILPDEDGTYNLHTYDRERRYWLTKIAAHYERLASRAP